MEENNNANDFQKYRITKNSWTNQFCTLRVRKRSYSMCLLHEVAQKSYFVFMSAWGDLEFHLYFGEKCYIKILFQTKSASIIWFKQYVQVYLIDTLWWVCTLSFEENFKEDWDLRK